MSGDADDLTKSGSLALDYSDSYSRDDFRTLSWRLGQLDRQETLTKRHHPTLLHALTAAARLDEPNVGITLLPERERDAEVRWTYRELYEDARLLAGGLEKLGVRPNDRVLIVLPTCLEFLSSFFGVLMVGAIPVPAYPPSGFRIEAGLEKLAHIAKHSGARVCITWKTIEGLLGDLAHESKALERIVDVESLRTTRLSKVHKTKASNVAFLQYTSGSTGNPKAVVLTHDNLLSNIHAMGMALEISRKDVIVGWCPLYHDMGLIGTFLSAVYWRTPLVLMPPTAFLAKPKRWLRAMSDHRGTISPAPNFGYALAVSRVKPEDREGLDLSCFRVALNGAEPVTLQAVAEFTRAYAPYGFDANAMFPVYGLAESSLAVTFPEPKRSVRALTVDRQALTNGRAEIVPEGAAGSIAICCVGKAVPGHSVRVVDDTNTPVADYVVGHVITAGPSVMQGYFGNAEATAAVLRDGWLRTGDLGFIENGELFVCGRAKDVIIVRGKNYHAEDVELYAERVEGVRRGGVVAFSVADDEGKDGVVLVCETRETDPTKLPSIAEGVKTAVFVGAGLEVNDVVLVPPHTIPKTSSGKRQRRRTKDAYTTGTLVPATPTQRFAIGLMYARSQLGTLRMLGRRMRQALAGDEES